MNPSAASDLAQQLGFADLVGTLRAVAEPTRLRLVTLLSRAELTVTEITQVIGQSQPRTSRHLRLLLDANVLERSPEGAFVYYVVADSEPGRFGRLLAALLPVSDSTVAADLTALEQVLHARVEATEAYRNRHAQELEALRGLHVDEVEVERAMLELLVSEGPIGRVLDIGTGTGRVLELLAPHSEHSVGLDVDYDMLLMARAALGEAQLSRATVRHGDLHRPPFEAASFDVAVMHNVLHMLDKPAEAVIDAARLLRPGGRLLIADFHGHELEQMRELHGHRQLGISEEELCEWAQAAALEVESERLLPPREAGQTLTVHLWLLRASESPRTNASASGIRSGLANSELELAHER